MNPPLTLIEPGIGQWRSADIDADELPSDLRFHDDISFSPLDAIFDARVTRVDHTLDMAFLDLGDSRTGMLNFRRARLLKKGPASSIGECVTEGQLIRVQVVAEPTAMENKALPVTPRPRLAGRYVVAETGAPRLNLSKDLTARRSKELKELLAPSVKNAALIVRSRAQRVPTEAVLKEANRLQQILSAPQNGPALVHAWQPGEKALLECPDGDTPVLVEGGSDFAEVKRIAHQHWPDLYERLAPYTAPRNTKETAFEAYGVEEAIEEALSDRIQLPSGGWLSITPTPAMTVVDVNMGSALKSMSAGEAKLVVNLEATLALAYHLRFQDIGGLIVVDYIDMSAKGSARELIQTIERTFRDDKVPVQHTGISAFGLVEITRRRSGLSLKDRMKQWHAPSDRPAATALKLLRRAVREGSSGEVGKLYIRAHKAVINWLEAHSGHIKALENQTGRTCELEVSHQTNDVFVRGNDG